MAAALTCDDVKPTLEACKEYVRIGGETVPPSCCYSALDLRNLVMSSAADRQIACHCIQDAAKQMTQLNRTAYADVPKRCGLRLPFHFEINMNCNKYLVCDQLEGLRLKLHSCWDASIGLITNKF
ncbi:hypothetical protein RJT34_17752 [Clitoria ternatea]|uniref:Bifunctional inhibitor/plant lipid transfer protein/seed storage helical domain-containing protein n=1 Tax=Clitoria ternatea TaxID=43366 RepID=A0AAN9J9I5_CLITE